MQRQWFENCFAKYFKFIHEMTTWGFEITEKGNQPKNVTHINT